MAFWMAATMLAVAAAIWVARPLALARRSVQPRAAFDEQVFRDQLLELDRDVDRGVLSEDEARAARIEVSRRLLAAAAERERASAHQPAPKTASLALAAAVVVGAPALALVTYAQLGAPLLPDQPVATRAEARPGQIAAERLIGPRIAPPPEGAEFAQLETLVGQLQQRMDEGEPDPRGLFLLARTQSQLGRFPEAWRSYGRLLGVAGDEAPGSVFAAMAESMILSAQGYVSPEAETALREALIRDPEDPIARYYLGMAYAQTGRVQPAMRMWSDLIARSPADAPWIPTTRAQMAELAAAAGVAAPAVQPLSDDPDAARASLEEVVAQLDARLTENGGAPQEWAQLVRSYKALGEPERAADADARARAALGPLPEPLVAFETALAAADPIDAETVAAAQGMDPEERMAMIRG
ncbi:MAG: c-type cytochrome biogenesis protein CcmI, partial [Rubrimonas sp.]